MRVLVIEDEPNAREILRCQLVERGHTVEVAADGEAGLRFGMECEWDAAIVDLGLPRIEGMEVLRRWRQSARSFPVLILTARSSWTDKVDAFGAGADAYVTKPYHVEEVAARLRSIVRRAGWGRSQRIVKCGPVVLDLDRQSVTVQGYPIRLCTLEYRILCCLMADAGKCVSHEQLIQRVYEEESGTSHATEGKRAALKVHIGQLRRKLDPTRALEPIEAIRGCGYRFALHPDPRPTGS